MIATMMVRANATAHAQIIATQQAHAETAKMAMLKAARANALNLAQMVAIPMDHALGQITA